MSDLKQCAHQNCTCEIIWSCGNSWRGEKKERECPHDVKTVSIFPCNACMAELNNPEPAKPLETSTGPCKKDGCHIILSTGGHTLSSSLCRCDCHKSSAVEAEIQKILSTTKEHGTVVLERQLVAIVNLVRKEGK